MRNGWQIRSWAREHEEHGTFHVSLDEDGRARVVRIVDNLLVETLGDDLPNIAVAFLSVEHRIAELELSCVRRLEKAA